MTILIVEKKNGLNFVKREDGKLIKVIEDDNEAIQFALDEVKREGGGEVWLWGCGPWIYRHIEVPDGVGLWGPEATLIHEDVLKQPERLNFNKS